jgi:hypothetical protein
LARLPRCRGDRLDDVDHGQDEESSPDDGSHLVFIEGRTLRDRLAASLGRETAPFKADVRKLKELGLTESLLVGYRLSPHGRAYLSS